ncbi:hypothetical protein [Pseudomonas sp. NPDC087614]|uniref:hypothetical protein n=1 Tax=Pseudomonas sp. NPDC087614 TaxID=3364442 RepID=UPI00381DF770
MDRPTISEPKAATAGLGTNPTLKGKAKANQTVEVFQVDSGNKLGEAKANTQGDWTVKINIPSTNWYYVTARSFSSQGEPDNWCPPHAVRAD